MKIYSTRRPSNHSFDRYVGKDLWLLLPKQPGYPNGRWVRILGKYPEYGFYMVNYVDNRQTSRNILTRDIDRTDALMFDKRFPKAIDVLTTDELYETLVYDYDRED